jgi:Leucine Rich repeat
MAIHEHLTEFFGRRVVDWDADEGIQAPAKVMYRVRQSYEEQDETPSWMEKFRRLFGAPEERRVLRWPDKFRLFLSDANASQVTGLVIGDWGLGDGMQESTAVVESLVEARHQLPKLQALFLGDVVSEECEISWLEHGDLSSLLRAYPQLEHFCVRGATNLSFGQLQHDHLKTLIVQSGGLGVSVVKEIFAAQLPELEHLELWLGEENYGGDATVQDLEPVLSGKLFPKLTYLGLRDSEIADDIAKAVANAPVVSRLKVLDLSMGTLSDEGAEALLASPLIPSLQKLDIHFHYCSAAVIAKFDDLGIAVDTSEPQEKHTYDNESWRYVAVSE